MKISFTLSAGLTLAVAALTVTTESIAQKSVQRNYAPRWTVNPYDHTAFIENRGQFDKDVSSGNKVLYQAMLGKVKAYFTSNGVIYKYDEFVKDEKASGKDVDPDRPPLVTKTYTSQMQWLGGNPSTTVVATDERPDYYVYPTGNKSSIKVNLYRKITYKNIYPGIDAEYTFPVNKDGIKYSLIVHPGADISKIKMTYKGAGMAIDKDGNLVATTSLNDMTEHTPVSYYREDNTSANTAFSLSGDIASFNGSDLDKTKTLVIDPWVTNPLYTYATNSAYDIDFDNLGNVYAFGGFSPLQLVKIDNTGAIQLTFNATTISTGYYGDIAVDRKTGTSYLTEGFRGSGAYAEKVNTSGSLTATFTGNPNLAEMWRAEYNPCNDNIVIAAGGTSASYQACMLDTNMVSITPVNVLSAGTALHDMSLIGIDPSGGFAYMATARSVVYPGIFNNVVMQLPIPTLSPTSYLTYDDFTFEEVGSITYVGGGTGVGNGMNGMAVSPNFLYMFDGAKLRKCTKSTGVATDSVTITGTSFQWGGLDVDPCDNVYAGNQSQINVYDPTLTLSTTIPLTNTVFDVVLGNDNLLYAGGKGYVTSMSVPSPSALISTASGSPTTCSACNGKASVTVNCGVAPFSFKWSNGATTSSDTGLCAGIYTVYVTDGSCPPRQDSAIVNVAGKAGYTAAVKDTNPGCALALGNITVYPTGGTSPYTYTWSNGATNQEDTGLVAGTYNCVITDSAGCKYTVSVTLINPNAPKITIAPPKDSVCKGSSATLTASGAKTYLWNPGTLSGSTVTVTPLVNTTYTVQGTDSNGCTGTASVTVIVNNPPVVKVTPPADSVCKGGSVVLTASGASTYTWSPGTGLSCMICPNPTATPTATTTYTVVGVDSKGCSDTTTVTVKVIPLPVPTITAIPDSICIGDSALLIAGGGGAYIWTFSGQTSDSIKIAPTTTETVTVQVTKDGCTAVTTKPIVVIGDTIPTISISKDSVCKGDSAVITAKGGKAYKWMPGGATTASITAKPGTTTTYTCIITTACHQDTLTEKLNVIPFPVITLSHDTTICSGQTVKLSASGGTTYLWSNSSTNSSITVSPVTTQTYTLDVSNGKCQKDTTVKITVNPPPVITVTPDQKVCEGTSVTLTATASGSTYLWSNGATTSSITVTPGSTTTYTVTASNGCESKDSVQVFVVIPAITACCNTTIISGDTVTINAYDDNSYIWSPSTSLSCSTCPNPIASPTVTTTYTVTGTDSNNCHVVGEVTIYVECLDFTVPNVFTPNNDGKNDDFVPYYTYNGVIHNGVGNVSSYSIIIYDRWGKQVYTSTDPTKYWDGTLNSTQYLVPDGVYYYIIKATCGNNNYEHHGFVQVLGGGAK
jgi:gliding motility-associated-like protein